MKLKPLYQQAWFIETVTWLNEHSSFWKKYIWGKSVNMEDFARNPAEVLRDTFFPFIVKDVKCFSLLNFRMGYIPYMQIREQEYYNEVSKYVQDITPCKGTYWEVPLGDNGFSFSIGKYSIFDLRIFNKWWTKFSNALLMFQFAVSLKYYVIPLPYFSFVLRYSTMNYFQFGIGYGPQPRGYLDPNPQPFSEIVYDTVLTIKLRFGNYLKELEWNPGSEVFGYYEGTV